MLNMSARVPRYPAISPGVISVSGMCVYKSSLYDLRRAVTVDGSIETITRYQMRDYGTYFGLAESCQGLHRFYWRSKDQVAALCSSSLSNDS